MTLDKKTATISGAEQFRLMLVMPANNCKNVVHYWAGKYGNLGHLYSPGGYREPVQWLPYALDNGAFIAFKNGSEWDESAFLQHCDRVLAVNQKPMWILVPDVVADREATISRWSEWEQRLRKYRLPLAFAVQDGMTPEDVPTDADVVFIGGSTAWKQANIARFCDRFPRVHVGRVNTWKWLWHCHDCGAESVDGTGWFRGDKKQLAELELYLRICAGEIPRAYQMTLEVA